MARYLHIAFAAVAWVFVALVVIQVFLIGLGLFDDPAFRETHREFGYTWIGLGALVLLIVAIAARPGRRLLGPVVGLVILYIIQTSLPGLRASYPAVAALHPVVALGIFVMAIQIARSATVLARQTADAGA
jgi:Family of unknown function (DUF6220)